MKVLSLSLTFVWVLCFMSAKSSPAQQGAPGNMSLVVRQTEDVHNQLGNVLNQLRQLQGQQIAVATPFSTANDSFYERIGVNFGFNIRGARGGRGVVGLNRNGQITPDIQFRQGSFGSAVPAFGGHDPNSDATLGFGALGKQGGAFFNFAFGQGSSRSIISQTPRVVIPNGGTGTISDTSQSPFVTGIIPVVGGAVVPTPFFPVYTPRRISPLAGKIEQLKQQQALAANAAQAHEQRGEGEAVAPPAEQDRANAAPSPAPSQQASTATHGDLSVAEIRRRQALEDDAQQQEIAALIERGRGAEQRGKPNVAKIYYRQAASRASGNLEQELLAKIEALGQ